MTSSATQPNNLLGTVSSVLVAAVPVISPGWGCTKASILYWPSAQSSRNPFTIEGNPEHLERLGFSRLSFKN